MRVCPGPEQSMKPAWLLWSYQYLVALAWYSWRTAILPERCFNACCTYFRGNLRGWREETKQQCWVHHTQKLTKAVDKGSSERPWLSRRAALCQKWDWYSKSRRKLVWPQKPGPYSRICQQPQGLFNTTRFLVSSTSAPMDASTPPFIKYRFPGVLNFSFTFKSQLKHRIPGWQFSLLAPEDGRDHILSPVAGTELIVCSVAALNNTCQNWLYFGYQLEMLDMYLSGSPHKRHLK